MNVLVLYNYSDKQETLEKDYSEEAVKECAFSVRKALECFNHQVIMFTLMDTTDSLKSMIELLAKGNIDIIFNLCEGFGWDSTMEHNIAGIFELLNIKFTGSGSFTLASCLNKGRTKEVLTFYGIRTPNFQTLFSPHNKIKKELTLPLIIKPLMEDASVGIRNNSVIYEASEIEKMVSLFFERYKKSALVEEYIDGREFNVAIMGNSELEVLPVSEIDFSGLPKEMNRICTYESKWDYESIAFRRTPPVCPAKIDSGLEEEIKEVAIKTYRAMECSDYARVDMRLSNDGKLYVLEANPNPDLSTDAGFSNIAKASGMSYETLILKILEIALMRYKSKQ